MNRLSLLLIALVLVGGPSPTAALAQLSLLPANPSLNKKDEGPPKPDTAAKRAEYARLLRIAQVETTAALPNGGEASSQVDLLKSIDAALAQQQAVEQQIKEFEARKEELRKELETLAERGVGEKPPYSFQLFDRLRDEVAAEKSRGKVLADKVAAATAARQQAKTDLDAQQRVKRQAQSEVDANNDPAKTAELAAALAKAEQEATLAAETFTLRKQELAREKLAQEIQALTLQLAEAKLAQVSQQVEFSSSDLSQLLAQVQKQEADTKLALSEAESNLRDAEKNWTKARNDHDQSTGDRKLLAEEVEARRWAREAWHQKVNMLGRQLQRLTQIRTLWERRFQVATGTATEEQLRTWLDEAKQILRELDREARVQQANIEERRKIATTLEAKAEAAKQESPEAASWIERQVAQVRSLLRLYEQELSSLENAQRLHNKLVKEVAPDRLKISPTEWWDSFSRGAVAFWNYELANIEESPLYVKTILNGLLLLVGGILASRLVAAIVVKRFLRHSKLSRDAKAAIQTLVFYTLLLIVVFLVLAMVQVPLTVFTVLGGALAIGIGLGSQNLVNNFFSGLVVMAERPVRIGDRIKFGAYEGSVEEVGFRSTRVRTLTDHVVTIPNATLVNDAIENVDRRRCIQRKFNLTITYDTPRDKIVEAIQTVRDVLAEEGIREPIHPVFGWDEFPPRVHFNDFNSDSLNIQVVYWYAPPNHWAYMLHAEKVNLRILEEFERLGVEFSFPTQTLYLAGDPRRELAVRTPGNKPLPPGSAA